jgi:excisionase family DNA binding protein
MSEKPYLTALEFAEQFSVCPKTVYRQIQAGKIPAFKLGGEWRIDMAAFWRKVDPVGNPDREQPARKSELLPQSSNDEVAAGEQQEKESIPGRKPRWLASLSKH